MPDGGAFNLTDNNMGGSLYNGSLQDGVITCPRHGAKYDAKTGKGLGKPKILFLEFKMENDLSYPVKVEGESILIDVNPDT